MRKACCGGHGQILDPGLKASPPVLGTLLQPLFTTTISCPWLPLLSFLGLSDLSSLLLSHP